MKNPNRREIERRALLAADWYVNSQIPMTSPDWNANTGRFIYNYHLPSRTRVSGINWTQARGIMVLMAAYRYTGRKKYLAAARLAVEYLKALQRYDRSLPYYGAFAEEVPQSWKCWPRDGAEAASGFLHLYNEAPDKDLLWRAKLYGDWMLSVSSSRHGFPPVYFYFEKAKKIYRPDYFTVGCGMFYGLLYQATGERKYLVRGLKPLVDAVPRRFMLRDGSLAATGFASHHCEKGRRTVLNDDGLGAALLSGARLFNSRAHLETAKRMGGWLLTQTAPVKAFCSLPNRLCYLMDLGRALKSPVYEAYVRSRMGEVLALQVTSSRDPFAKGAFRGEDEPTDGYIRGTRQIDYVTNRTTAYAALLLFKLLHRDWTPGYSAFGWKRKPVKT